MENHPHAVGDAVMVDFNGKMYKAVVTNACTQKGECEVMYLTDRRFEAISLEEVSIRITAREHQRRMRARGAPVSIKEKALKTHSSKSTKNRVKSVVKQSLAANSVRSKHSQRSRRRVKRRVRNFGKKQSQSARTAKRSRTHAAVKARVCKAVKNFGKGDVVWVDHNDRWYRARILDTSNCQGKMVVQYLDATRAQEDIDLCDVSLRIKLVGKQKSGSLVGHADASVGTEPSDAGASCDESCINVESLSTDTDDEKEAVCAPEVPSSDNKENASDENSRTRISGCAPAGSGAHEVSFSSQRLSAREIEVLDTDGIERFQRSAQWYDMSPYEQQVCRQRWSNASFLRQLNIASAKAALAESAPAVVRKASQPARAPRRSKHSKSSAPPRRSARQRGQPVRYVNEVIERPDVAVPLQFSRKNGRRPRSLPLRGTSPSQGSVAHLAPPTAEQRALLDAADGWLEEFRMWLVTPTDLHKPVSEDNRRQVMRAARALASGAGIGYRHWPSSVVFCAGRPISLGSDFLDLILEGQALEEQHGRDRGNGWLFKHACKKLWLFQQHKLRIDGGTRVGK
jgi:hypothetical protein